MKEGKKENITMKGEKGMNAIRKAKKGEGKRYRSKRY